MDLIEVTLQALRLGVLALIPLSGLCVADCMLYSKFTFIDFLIQGD
jgi:hypothetical protein